MKANAKFWMADTGARMRKHLFALAITLCACLATAVRAGAQHQHSGGEPEKVGNVEFATSCNPAVQSEFSRAVALLHSFWYQKAADTFAGVAKQDPSCGIAEWGVAMTHYHELWDAPSRADLQAGWEAVERAKSAGAKTQRERDYIAAMEAFYKDSGKFEHRTRAIAYEKAMEQVYARYPKDREAAIFYALAVRADAPPADKTYANQKKASAILEKILAEQPEHPGLAHYIIHCDDYPSLAALALDAARHYAKIAPDAPHALHMPSHIFTRLGLWQESIDSNLASAAAAKKHGLAGDELHAMDYLVYAYLQMGQDHEARSVLDTMPKAHPDDAAYFTALYATASIPARLAVERHRWAEAAALPLPPNTFPGGRYLWTEADLYYARALGAARMKDADAARSALQQLTSLRDKLVELGNRYSAEQVDIQREAVIAWISFGQDQGEEALRQMRAAADHEDATDKLPVTPGPIVPARELLGEMLLESKQAAPALEAFEAALRSAPGRLNALYGAARAAELAGNRDRAKNYFSQLIANCPHANPERAEVREAKLFLDVRDTKK
jgi:tetratricopeptide (TPR) repeat protein